MASVNNVERIRGRLERGEVSIGAGVSFSDPAVSELYGEAGYDFSWVDMEHSPLDPSVVQGHLLASRGTDMAPFVRVPQNDVNVIKPVLDLGPAGIIIPQVNSADGVAAAVQACRYPPVGVRGFGPQRRMRYGVVSMVDYLREMEDEPIIVIQMEHIEVVEQIDAMLDVEKIDVFCFGPNDLAGSMGKLGQLDDPEVVAAIDAISKKVVDRGRVLGSSIGYTPENYKRWIDRGATWINLDVDWDQLFRDSRVVLEQVREK